jgi:hypothetical protein
LNGVCQTLPIEGVSDSDYDFHIRKHHIFKSNFCFPKYVLNEIGYRSQIIRF